MFIRLKKIKGKYYAYYVRNRRIRGKVKQKVLGYLGNTIIPEKNNKIDFYDFIKENKKDYAHNKNFQQIVFDLINWEMERHNLNDLYFDSEKISFIRNDSKIVVKMNDGYLYDDSLRNLLKFKAVGDDEYFIGRELAELFVKAGIDVPKELFVKMFEKLIKK